MALGALSILVGGDISGLVTALQSMQEKITSACSDGAAKLDGIAEHFGKVSSGAEEVVSTLSSKWGSIANTIETAMTNPAIAAAAAVVGIATAAFEVGENFETASITIQQKTGTIGEDLEALNTTAAALFTTLPTSMGTIADTVSTLHQRLGDTVTDLTTLGTYFVSLGEVTGTPANDLAAAATAMTLQWSIAATDIPTYMNQILTASQNTGVPVAALVESLTDAGPMFKALGLDLTDAAGFIAELGRQGISTSTAMTGLRTLFKNMTDQDIPDLNAEFDYQIQRIKDADTATAAYAIGIEDFGKKGGAMAVAIHSGNFDLDDLATKMTNGTTNAVTLAANTEDLGKKFTLLKNSVEDLLKPLGELLLAFGQDIVNGFLTAKNKIVDLGTAIDNGLTSVSNYLGGLSGMKPAHQDVADVLNDVATPSWDGLGTTIKKATDASGDHLKSSKELADQKKAEADAVKAAAEQTQFEAAQDKSAAEELDTRNKNIDFFTKALVAAGDETAKYSTATVDWTNVTDNAAFAIVGADQAMKDMGVTSQDAADTKINDLNLKLATLKDALGDAYKGSDDYQNMLIKVQTESQNLHDKVDPLNTLLSTLGLTTLVDNNTKLATMKQAYADLIDNTDKYSAELGPDKFQQVAKDAKDKIDAMATSTTTLGGAYDTLGLKSSTVMAQTVTDAYNAATTISTDETTSQAARNLAWKSYYDTKKGYDDLYNPGAVASDQTMLDNIATAHQLAIDSSTGTLTLGWKDYYDTITKAEDTFVSGVVSDFIDGKKGLFQSLADGLVTLGKNIATAFATEALEKFVHYVTANLFTALMGDGTSGNGGIAGAFGSLGTAITKAFTDGTNSLNSFLSAITGGTGKITGATGGGIHIGGGSGGIGGITGTSDSGTLGNIGTGAGGAGDITVSGADGVETVTGGIGDAASSSSGILGAIGGLGGIVGAGISGLVSGVITAVNDRVIASQQNKVFENIQNDTDLLREWWNPDGGTIYTSFFGDKGMMGAIWTVDDNIVHVQEDVNNFKNWFSDAANPIQLSLGAINTNLGLAIGADIADIKGGLRTFLPVIGDAMSAISAASVTMVNQITVTVSDLNAIAEQIGNEIASQLQLTLKVV